MQIGIGTKVHHKITSRNGRVIMMDLNSEKVFQVQWDGTFTLDDATWHKPSELSTVDQIEQSN